MTVIPFPRKKKLSPYCIGCGQQHSVAAMRQFIEGCARDGADPLAAPKRGFLCVMCVGHELHELVTDPETPDELRDQVRGIIAKVKETDDAD